MKVDTDPKKIDEFLTRAVEDVIVKENLRTQMLSGKQLSIYLGTDPTGPELHLGHTVVHKKLRDIQELGHKVTLVVGDFTVLVGDHSDKEDQRYEINHAGIEENIKTYKEQFAKTVDLSSVDLRYNSEWLSKLNFNDVIKLAKVFTLQQMSERDAFVKRVKEGKPVGFDELLYPLMQGYDAYALKTDIQIGATDQLFNMQAGRKIMESFGATPQNIIITPLLVGNDGRKMGKSLKNFIPIQSSPFEMYSGVMSIIDDIIIDYFILLTRIPMLEIEDMKKSLENKRVNPRDLKMKLSFLITKDFHGETAAINAENEFKKIVQEGGLPENLPTKSIQKLEPKLSLTPTITQLLINIELAPSISEAKRLVQQGGVEVNGEKITNPTQQISLKPDMTIRAGKKGFVKLV